MNTVDDLVPKLDPAIVAGRRAMLRRVVDFVAIPASGYTSRLERAIAGDILLGMLIDADVSDKRACAQRLSVSTDAPRRLLRYLCHCSFEIAQPVLEDNTALDCQDLKEIIEHGSLEHLIAIARRRNLSENVSHALVARGELEPIKLLLDNKSCSLSESSMDLLIKLSNANAELCPLIAAREEIIPSQSLSMFWWCDATTRLRILKHQTGERVGLINSVADMFKDLSPDERNDEVISKALVLIDRRQRNRKAMAASSFASLEALVESASVSGMSADLVQEMAYICNVKSVVLAKLLTDKGGEGIAVVCKSVGLKRDFFKLLWRALRRPITQGSEEDLHPEFERVMDVYLMLSVSKAQTALRYWNWSLGANFLPSADAL
ncbi:MAG: DUF2336 domain-containing protein [Pseudomonadota bacterium]